MAIDKQCSHMGAINIADASFSERSPALCNSPHSLVALAKTVQHIPHVIDLGKYYSCSSSPHATHISGSLTVLRPALQGYKCVLETRQKKILAALKERPLFWTSFNSKPSEVSRGEWASMLLKKSSPLLALQNCGKWLPSEAWNVAWSCCSRLKFWGKNIPSFKSPLKIKNLPYFR